MTNPFFDAPILNKPYSYPDRHWELDKQGQPTQRIERRRKAEFITPIPKPKKRKDKAEQAGLAFDEGEGLSTATRQYEHVQVINAVRSEVDQWRQVKNPKDWKVFRPRRSACSRTGAHTPSRARPFFCQIEAVETAIFFRPRLRRSLQRRARRSSTPTSPRPTRTPAARFRPRLALKLATGPGKTTVMAMLIAWQTI